MKLCKRCSTSKPIEQFYKHNRSGHGSSYCKPCTNDYHKEWNSKNKERSNALAKGRRKRLKVSVMSHYSNGVPTCACCGEDEIAFLTIDHINGRPADQPRQVFVGTRMLHFLRNEGHPPGYQVLCMNCNWAKYANGVCPHKMKG